MIVRALDINNDWTFGKGKNDYLKLNSALGQCIKTRLLSFLGDCFFDAASGLDWFTFLGSKNEIALRLAISSTILNTPNVTGILILNSSLGKDRIYTISYKVNTIYSTITGNFSYDMNGVI